MVSGDHYVCNSCYYEWRTRKDVGEPYQCVKCRALNIEEEGARRRRLAREAEARKEREKERQKKLSLERKNRIEREKILNQLRIEREEKLNKLKRENPFLYLLLKHKTVILIILASVIGSIFLNILTYSSTHLDKETVNQINEEYLEQSNSVDETPITEIPKENITNNQVVETEPALEEEPEPFIEFINNDYSLSNPFMNYSTSWVVSGTFESRVRVKEGDTLKSFIFTIREPLYIAIPIKNGCYKVQTFHGDLAYAQGPHYLEIEGEVINEYGYNEKGKFINFETVACVEDGLLNLVLGSSTAYLEKEFTFRDDDLYGYSNLNAIGIKSVDSKTYYINFGEGSNVDEDKTAFLLNGFQAE